MYFFYIYIDEKSYFSMSLYEIYKIFIKIWELPALTPMEWIELNSFDFITHACVKNTFMKATYLFLTKHKYYSEKFSDRIN